MWKAKLMGGEEFFLDDNQAKALTTGMEKRLPVNLGFAIINGTSVACIVNQDIPEKSNQIMNDECFGGYLEGDGRSIDALNARYSGDKFRKEWEDAISFKRNYLLNKNLLDEPKQ